ncbi:MAG: glycosyl hydrolase family 18 protein [Candidatus Marinimicrobia bacterium]|nr:glycosyl hydrolase family 18 protein [Candidatus Neomarinimicrobiota bacterium]
MKHLVHIMIILSIGSVCLLGQSEPEKPHGQQAAQYGHIQVDQQGDFVGFPQDLVERPGFREPSHVVFGYHPYWNGTAWLNYEYNMLSHIAWFGLNMSSSGSITNSHGWPINGLVDLAHSHGVKVIVTVTQFDNSAIGTLLGNAASRQTAINNLISAVSQGNADGVNIDFEFVPTASRNNFNTFIHDLTVAFHDQIPGSEVSIAMPSVDWWNSYDYDYLSDNSDGLMIMAYGYYWSGSANAGPLSPLNSGLSSWYIRRTVEDYLTKTGDDGSQLILGLPWYGRDWPVSSTAMGAPTTGSGSSILYSAAEANAQSYGKHYNANAPSAWYNYNSGGLRQVWYDDSLSLATKYNYAKEVEIKGIGIWALGYDGGRAEIWGGLSDAFGATSPPLSSQYFTVRNVGDGTVAIHCAPSIYTDFFEAHISLDGSSFSLAHSSPSQDFLLEGLEPGQLIYVKIRNTNTFGSGSFSEVLGVVVSSTTVSSVLIVQGFERTSGTMNNLDYIIEHGSAVHATGRIFDAASNDAIENGTISLTDYDVVDWISGEEATATVSFSPAEQSRIRDYLEQGGRLFISGSEIGYDLEANGSDNDLSFYRNYFKADYIVDNTQSYSTSGPANGIFAGLSGVAFDDGTHGTYDVDYPDGIKPFGGAVNNLRYEGADYAAQGGAGIQFMGNFGESTALGGVVYLGFGFETIYPEATRNIVMGRVLDFLEISVDIVSTAPIPNNFKVSRAFPNPFNGSFSFSVYSNERVEATISLFNLKGQLVHHLSQRLQVGENQLSVHVMDQKMLSSGVYVLQVASGTESHSQNITYLK